jgi:hypothetical protein
MPGTARRASTGTKVLQTIGVLTAWVALVGFGTFGTFTELPSWADLPDDTSLTSAG